MTATTAAAAAGAATTRRRLPRSYYAVAAMAPWLLLVAWGLLVLARPAPALRIGAAAPAFAVVDLEGNRLRLADLRGRPVVVNFWASWCRPCRAEAPLLTAAAAAHRGDGLAIVGIVFQDRSDAARAFAARVGATWPSAIDYRGAVASQFGIIWPPDTFFIDRDGVVQGRQLGQLSAADLQRGLSQILKEER